MSVAWLSTAYLAPVRYYSKLVAFDEVRIELHEFYPKQTYRNRCYIAAANGIQTLTVPIEKPDTPKCLTRDIRISDHGNWRHLHWQSLVSAYHKSPFFEYYADDFLPFYQKQFKFLYDFNQALQAKVCELIDIQPAISYTESYNPAVNNDFRTSITPRYLPTDTLFSPLPYYQVFREKHGFIPNLSIVDLLFNMGPESLFFL